MLNNLFTILNNEPEKPRPFLHKNSKKGATIAKNPDSLANARRMLNAKTVDEYLTILREVYSTWETPRLVRMIAASADYNVRHPSERARRTVEVLKEILQSKKITQREIEQLESMLSASMDYISRTPCECARRTIEILKEILQSKELSHG